MDVISKRNKLEVWDWSRMRDPLKIFQMVTDFVYFLLFKHGYFKRKKRSIFFQNLSDEKILSFVIHKGFKSSKKLSKSMTLRKPFKKSVI